MDNSVDARPAETSLRSTVRGDWRWWAPADELCPPWWPRRTRSPRATGRSVDVHLDVRAADRVYAALTLLATTFSLRDEQLVREVRLVALAHLLEGARVLARGATRAWEQGDEVCPPWPAGRPSLVETELPGRATQLLDGLVLLQAYNLAAKIPHPVARGTATAAVGQVLLAEMATAARTLA